MNKCIFIDIFNVLINTKSNKNYPIVIADWEFNDKILKYIKSKKDYEICVVNNFDNNFIFNKSFHDKLINFITDKLEKILKKPVISIYYKSSDSFFNYPNPGGIYNVAIEYDLFLNNCEYISKNDKASSFSSIGLIINPLKFTYDIK